MRKTLIAFTTTICLAVPPVATSASAHHSHSIFDRDKTITLTGTVKEFQWTNPHVWIEVITDEPGSGQVVWDIEGGSPSVLARGGWRSSAVKPGDKISLGIHPRRDGVSGGWLADEQQVLINSQPVPGVLYIYPAQPSGDDC